MSMHTWTTVIVVVGTAHGVCASVCECVVMCVQVLGARRVHEDASANMWSTDAWRVRAGAGQGTQAGRVSAAAG